VSAVFDHSPGSVAQLQRHWPAQGAAAVVVVVLVLV
jgi:hypothetical protein